MIIKIYRNLTMIEILKFKVYNKILKTFFEISMFYFSLDKTYNVFCKDFNK